MLVIVVVGVGVCLWLLRAKKPSAFVGGDRAGGARRGAPSGRIKTAGSPVKPADGRATIVSGFGARPPADADAAPAPADDAEPAAVVESPRSSSAPDE